LFNSWFRALRQHQILFFMDINHEVKKTHLSFSIPEAKNLRLCCKPFWFFESGVFKSTIFFFFKIVKLIHECLCPCSRRHLLNTIFFAGKKNRTSQACELGCFFLKYPAYMAGFFFFFLILLFYIWF